MGNRHKVHRHPKKPTHRRVIWRFILLIVCTIGACIWFGVSREKLQPIALESLGYVLGDRLIGLIFFGGES